MRANPLHPIHITVGELEISSLTAADLPRFDEMAKDVYSIFSDERTLQFIPEKRLGGLEEAKAWLQSSILNFHTGRNYMYLIRSKRQGGIVGVIDILSPALVSDHYKLDEYPYFIEFYLKGKA